jgi:hypothetical protein
VSGTTEADRRVGDVALVAVTDAAATLLSLETTPSSEASAALVGRRVAGGFRAALGDLRSGSARTRFLRRLLWDLPILAQVSHQTALLDHPAIDGDVRVPVAGADQCSGWRSGGEMLTRIASHDGVLRMELGPSVRQPLLPAEIWGGTLEALAPWATRRARATAVSRTAAGVEVRLWFRDSYADPDGVERALHQWWVSAVLDGRGRLTGVSGTAGQLPWLECPWAAHSALALEGLEPEAVEHAVAQDFRGIGTCTHLNDTLRTLAELPDLLGRLPRAA